MSVQAADLPKLPDDPAISRGVLPDGLSYMLVANPAAKGTADIAILLRACQTEVEVPAALFARKCVGPGSKGFVQHKEDNVIYRFENFPVAGGDTYVDSLLLSVMKISGQAAASGEPAYGTTNQTIIIAGDIDRNAIAYKLKMLSLYVPKGESVHHSDSYVWQPGEKLTAEVSEGEGPSRITFEYRLPAMPRENNNTVATVVSDQFSEIFKTVLTSSVRRYMRVNSIHDGTVAFFKEMSDTRLGDDVYRLEVTVPLEKVEATTRSVASILDKMVRGNVSRAEYSWAYDKFLFDRNVLARRTLTNADYVDRCINAVLYNASLATEAEKYRFYSEKELADSLRLKHFNMFGMSLGAEDSRLAVRVDSAPSGMNADSLLRVVEEGRSLGCSLVDVNITDTLGLVSPMEKKCKKPSVKKDVITGGQLMVYDNGITIIYKQMNTGGVFHYTWMFHGGSDTPVDLRDGNVGSLTGDSFINLLESCGITVEVVTTSKGIRLEGHFASRRFMLFLKAMQALFAAHPEFGSPSTGTLVLVGDRTQYSLEKILQVMVGTFDTSAPARKRTVVDDVWELDRKDESIFFQSIYQVDYLYSAENMMTARVARMVINDALIDAFLGTGCCAEVKGAFVTSPRDRYTLDIKVRHVNGMEARISDSAARTIVRETLASLAAATYSPEKVAIAKTLLQGRIAKEQGTPEYWLNAARLRFTESKDMVAKYGDKIAQVTPEKVRDLIKVIAADGPDELYRSVE